jgi:hypothetical protein
MVRRFHANFIGLTRITGSNLEVNVGIELALQEWADIAASQPAHWNTDEAVSRRCTQLPRISAGAKMMG